MTTQDFDSNIWRELPFALDNGYVPKVPREYLHSVYDGFANKTCLIRVRIDLGAAPTVTESGAIYYPVTAIYGHQIYFACHKLVKLSDLEPVAL